MTDDDGFQEDTNALQESPERMPTSTDWGFCAYGDAPPGIGGGMPWFCWFEDEKGMLAAIREHGAWMNPPRRDLDPAKLQAKVAAILKDDVRFPNPDVMARLDRTLKNASQFEWIGPFKRLVTGDSNFEKKIRRDFRFDQDKEDEGSISGPELPEFAQFIRDYGL